MDRRRHGGEGKRKGCVFFLLEFPFIQEAEQAVARCSAQNVPVLLDSRGLSTVNAWAMDGKTSSYDGFMLFLLALFIAL
jgi:hypothetical protein